MGEKILKKSLTQHLKDIEINKVVEFPLSNLTSVRSILNRVSLQYDRRFTTTSDREKRVLFVKRLS